MDNNTDAYEFDKTNPHQNVRDFMLAMQESTSEGSGDMVNNILDGMPDDPGVDLIKNMLKARKDPRITTIQKVSDAADAGDLAEALAVIDAAKKAGRLDTADVLILKANAYERVGDMEMVLKMTKESNDPHDRKSYGYIADLLYRLGCYDELADLCDMWQDSYYARTDLYLSRARLMYVKGDAAGAQRHINAMLKLEEFAPEAHEMAGDILADEGDLRGAVMRYNDALEQEYNSIHFHVKKAEALVKMGRPDAAALACRRGLEIRPQNKRLNEILAESQGLDTLDALR